MKNRSVTPEEISFQVRRGYLERLAPRIRRMRKLYAERNWLGLRTECEHIRDTASRFGFDHLTSMASEAGVKLGALNPDNRKVIENFLSAVDHLLIKDLPNRH